MVLCSRGIFGGKLKIQRPKKVKVSPFPELYHKFVQAKSPIFWNIRGFPNLFLTILLIYYLLIQYVVIINLACLLCIFSIIFAKDDAENP